MKLHTYNFRRRKKEKDRKIVIQKKNKSVLNTEQQKLFATLPLRYEVYLEQGIGRS